MESGEPYVGPPFKFTSSVNNLRRLPRFGHGSDFTAVLSSNREAQEDYAAGLVSLFVFLLIVFLLWTIAIVTFKVMGPVNAGFLSGHRLKVPDEAEDEANVHKRPPRVRVVFLVATALLMTFSFVLVAMGLTNVNNAAATMEKSLTTAEGLMESAKVIAINLEKVGDRSIEIRDAAVEELDDICPADADIGDTVGMDIMGIAEQARTDLTMLADFIRDGLEALNKNLALAQDFTDDADDTLKSIEFWGWEMKLLSAGLFILPSFLAVGVGLVMLDIDNQPYQKSLSYFFMPLFAATIVACYVVCCLILPVSAIAADACSGGGNVRGGPDDTIMTVYRNLRGDDLSSASTRGQPSITKFVGFYTQQCNAEYYPFDFMNEYLDDLDEAIKSTNTAVKAMSDNQILLEIRCGRTFDVVLELVKDMNRNLKLLQKQAFHSLDLISCRNINRLYVNTVHEAGCTYSVDALAWIFSSSLVISVCGLIMIMLRSAYLPTEYLELTEAWSMKPTESESRDLADGGHPVTVGREASRAGSSSPSAWLAGDVEPTSTLLRNATPVAMSPAHLEPSATPSRPAPGSVTVSQINNDEFEVGHKALETGYSIRGPPCDEI